MTAQTISPTSAALDASKRRDEMVAFGIMAVLFAAAPLGIYPFFMMQALCFALFACAFNLLIGYVGLLSFGHAMFLGLAGYVSAHMAKHGTIAVGPINLNFGPVDPVVAILFGVASSAILVVITGALAIRRQGIYFAMITLALSQMIYFFCLQAPFTGGENGIQDVPRGRLFGLLDLSSTPVLYGFVLCIFVFGFGLVWRTVHSPFGHVLQAIRENEARAISLGYDADRYKLLAYVLSGALSGLAGGTKALVFQLATLTDVHWAMSGEVVLMTLVGGLGTLFGPVAGAAVIVTMQNHLAHLGAWVTVVQGLVFVVCVLAFRRGIVGEIARLTRRSL